VATIFCNHARPRPWGHHHTCSAHPPQCLARCELNFARSLITTRRSANRTLKRSSAVTIAVSQPFLSRSWSENSGKLGFWAAVRSFLALHNLKPVLARQKEAEGAFKAPCCGSTPFVIADWRYILGYDHGAITYPPPRHQFSAAGSRDGSETAIVTAENAKPTRRKDTSRCSGSDVRYG
jgi:hypothetical protein